MLIKLLVDFLEIKYRNNQKYIKIIEKYDLYRDQNQTCDHFHPYIQCAHIVLHSSLLFVLYFVIFMNNVVFCICIKQIIYNCTEIISLYICMIHTRGK